MESKKLSINLYAMQYGLLLGFAMIIFDLIMYIFKAPIGSSLSYINFIIILAFIVYGSINLRNKLNNALIKYSQSLLTCFLIALYGGIAFAIYKYFFFKFFDHSMVTKIADYSSTKIINMNKMDEDTLDKYLTFQRKWVWIPGSLSLVAMLNTLIVGTIFGLIVSIFVKKEDNSFEAATNTDKL